MQRAENQFRQSAHCVVAKIAKENVFADMVSDNLIPDYYASHIVISGQFDVTIAYTKNDILLNGAMDERHCTGVLPAEPVYCKPRRRPPVPFKICFATVTISVFWPSQGRLSEDARRHGLNRKEDPAQIGATGRYHDLRRPGHHAAVCDTRMLPPSFRSESGRYGIS